ncbi:MAG: AEC family transporter [Erysipelotrichaceae bacterium]
MSELIFALELVVPIVLIISLGYLLKKLKLINDNFLAVGNKLVFKVFLPVLLFYNTYNSDLSEDINFWFFIYVMLVILTLLFIGVIIFSKLVKEKTKIGPLVQFMFRINYSVVGYPIILGLTADSNSAVIAMATIIIVSLNNIFSVIVLSYYGDGKCDVKSVIKNIVTNPLIIALVLGFLAASIELQIPIIVLKSLNNIKIMASPFALIILGGGFSFRSAKNNMPIINIALILKFLVLPAIGLTISILLGFRDVQLAILLVIFCAPTAVSSFVMAQGFKNDGELAGQLVVFSTLATGFSLVIFISILKMMSYL